MEKEIEYSIKISSELLIHAKMNDIPQHEILDFFSVQLKRMIECPQNLKYFGKPQPVWLLRGFYPNSPVFFKMVVVYTGHVGNNVYYGKVTALRHHSYGKYGNKYDNQVIVTKRNFEDYVKLKMENALLGADHDLTKIEPFNKKLKMPRCMSPKGMELFRYKKPSRRKTNNVKLKKN